MTSDSPLVVNIEIPRKRIRWWRCGAAWIDTLGSWSGYGFRAAWEVPGLPICTLWRLHRGPHFFERRTSDSPHSHELGRSEP
jgi:hypothetical protein